MPIPLPNLDDRTFSHLMAELRTLIPRHAPGWTDHNPSDPGITLLELLAWLSEMTLYRLNRIPPQHVLKFLTLIGEEEYDPAKAVEKLWKPYRAITAADFERLAIEANPGRVARARCLVNHNLEHTTKDETGHISIMIVPKTEDIGVKPVPDSDLRAKVLDYLLPRRLITSRVHVAAPYYLDVAVPFQVRAQANEDQTLLEERVRQRLRGFLHPVSGGPGAAGWPFGRDVAISEVYRLIEETPGVDYTIEARLLPAAQFVNLYFAAGSLKQSLASAAVVASKDNLTRFSIAGLPGSDAVGSITVKGFRQGDRLMVVHRQNPYCRLWLTVDSVSTTDWKELTLHPFQVPETFPAGSLIASEDKNIVSAIGQALPAGRELNRLTITGFQAKDIIDIKAADGEIIGENIELTRLERCCDRVYLEEEWLPWYLDA